MNCPQCNAPLPQDAKFCFNCGLALTGVPVESEYPQPQPQSQSQPLSQPISAGQAASSPSQAQPLYAQPPFSEPPYSAPPPFSQAPSSQPLSYPSEAYPSGAYPPPYYAPASQPFPMNPSGAWGVSMPPVPSASPPTKGRVIFFTWTPLIILGVALIALAGPFVVAANLGDKSWMGGDIAAAIAAFGVGALALVTVIVQLATRQWKRLSFAFNLALVVVLALLGTGGIAFKTQVGILDAQHYAVAGDWTDALKQYTLLANDPSCGHDCQRSVTSGVAHAHYEYGYQLEGENNYSKAISQFEASLTAAPAGADAVPAHVELSHAHYSYGLQFASQKEYLEAISEFEQAVNAAPSGPYAQEAHLATASAYYAVAQQDLAGSSCQSAVLALETIVQNYSDAPEANQARADLVAPVKVTGTFDGYPKGRSGQAWLSKTAHVPRYSAPAPYGSYSFSGDYKTPIDPKSGNFTFARVVPGNYTLTLYRYDTRYPDSAFYTWWYASNNVGAYFVQVGPLCPFTWPAMECDNLCS